MKNKFYITTPIYYVNDNPHIGHAYTSLACDTIAKFKRLDGYKVKFLTGTDEHGQKIYKTASEKKISPLEFVNQISKNFFDLNDIIGIENDDFIRTTEPRHKKAVSFLWQKLIDSGQIYLSEYSGWYAVRDESFYDEKELINGKAPTGADVEWIVEPCYFFKLSQWQDKLLDFYEKNPDFIRPDSRKNEVISFVKSGLKDLCISRTTIDWGIPVPNDENHVIYVWLDALTNYITALGYPENFDEDFWKNSLHVVGKDILKFHGIYWVAFLMAAGLNPPKQIFAHGWWTNEGVKISKSLGNVIDPVEQVKEFGSDVLRYFLLREITFGQDGNFSRNALIGRLNSDLANSYGNLVQRVLSLIVKNCDGKIPDIKNFSELKNDDKNFLSSADNCLDSIRKNIDNLEINRYIDQVWQLIFAANKYVDEQKPWSLKNTDLERMNQVLYVLVNYIKKIAILTQPILPKASSIILDSLNVSLDKRNFSNLEELLKEGHMIDLPSPIFMKTNP
jgi:methionyl-tRNA synthetase